MTTIFDFCNNTVYLKERKDNSSILIYGIDDKYLEFEISDFGTIKENSINTNMNKAQTYCKFRLTGMSVSLQTV